MHLGGASFKRDMGPGCKGIQPRPLVRTVATELEKKYLIPANSIMARIQFDGREANPDLVIQYGAGYASCPGHHLAKMELSKTLATVVRDYEIRQVDPNQEWKCKGYMSIVARPCLPT